MNFSELTPGESYSYSPIPAALWPNQTNARYEGKVSYSVASKMEQVHALHASALAYLPPNTTKNAQTLSYLIFTINGQQKPVAEEWINVATLKRVSNGTRTVVISNASEQDDMRIRRALQSAGFLVSSIG